MPYHEWWINITYHYTDNTLPHIIRLCVSRSLSIVYRRAYYISNWLLVLRLIFVAFFLLLNQHLLQMKQIHITLTLTRTHVHAHGISTKIHSHVRDSTYVIGFTIVSFLPRTLSRSFLQRTRRVSHTMLRFSHRIASKDFVNMAVCVCASF